MSEEDVQRTLGRLEEKVQAVLDAVRESKAEHKEGLENVSKRADALEARVRDLEAWKWKAIGFAAAVGTVGGFSLSRLVGAE